jgi:hypothetical protein
MMYSPGHTTSVSAAAENNPPPPPTASGCCPSDPMRCESASGVSPSIAKSVVIKTVRKRTREPSNAAWYAPIPDLTELVEVTDPDNTVEDGLADWDALNVSNHSASQSRSPSFWLRSQ